MHNIPQIVTGSMTIFAPTQHKQLSAGSLWQEGAVSASRWVEKYMTQEEQLLHLSDLYQTSHSEYDRNGVSAQLLIRESVNDAGNAPSDNADGQREGCVTGTTFLWRATGGKLYLWDNADKSHIRSCTLTMGDQAVTAVALAFVPSSEEMVNSSKYWLVVSTTANVSLFYFNPNTISQETPPVLSGYVSPTGGTIISSICRPNSCGRIFLGGTDGSVLEFVYRNHLPSTISVVSQFLGITHRRSYLSIITRPWGYFLRPLRSLFGLNQISTDNRVLSINVDTCRGLVYVLKKCGVEVLDLDTLTVRCDMSAYAIAESVRSAHRAASSVPDSVASNDRDILVELLPANPHVGGDILFVLVTRSGARVFVKRGAGFSLYNGPAVVNSACKSCHLMSTTASQTTILTKPNALSVACVKLPERHPHLNIVAAFSGNSGRCIFMVSSQSNGSPSGIVVVRPDEAAIVAKQQLHMSNASSHSQVVRERYDFVPLGSAVDIKFANLVLSKSCPLTVEHLAPSDGLYSIAVDDLRISSSSELVVITSPDARQVSVRVPRMAEIVVDALSSISNNNVIAARDICMYLGADQFAAQLSSILMELSSPHSTTMSSSSSHYAATDVAAYRPLIEQILFDFHTATALGLVDNGASSSNFGHSFPGNPNPMMNQLLGSAVHGGGRHHNSSTPNVSMRTRGLAILLSRLLRPIWLAKLFKLDYRTMAQDSRIMTIKPVLSSTQRTYVCLVIKPFLDMLSTYRQSLVAGQSQNEIKIIEGLIVVSSGVVECMEMLRLFESGQLQESASAGVTSQGVGYETFNNLSNLSVRDIVLSIGDSGSTTATAAGLIVNEFMSTAQLDATVLRKHCSLLFPRI